MWLIENVNKSKFVSYYYSLLFSSLKREFRRSVLSAQCNMVKNSTTQRSSYSSAGERNPLASRLVSKTRPIRPKWFPDFFRIELSFWGYSSWQKRNQFITSKFLSSTIGNIFFIFSVLGRTVFFLLQDTVLYYFEKNHALAYQNNVPYNKKNTVRSVR